MGLGGDFRFGEMFEIEVSGKVEYDSGREQFSLFGFLVYVEEIVLMYVDVEEWKGFVECVESLDFIL